MEVCEAKRTIFSSSGMDSILCLMEVAVNCGGSQPRHANCEHVVSFRSVSTTGAYHHEAAKVQDQCVRHHPCLGERGRCDRARRGAINGSRRARAAGGCRAGGCQHGTAAGAALTNRPEDEKAIKQVAETFTHAFNAGDAKAVAALYTHNAELIDEFGDRIEGRAAIQDFYSALFNERKGATIEVSMTSLRFLGSDTAKEQGQTRVRPSRNRLRPFAITRFFS